MKKISSNQKSETRKAPSLNLFKFLPFCLFAFLALLPLKTFAQKLNTECEYTVTVKVPTIGTKGQYKAAAKVYAYGYSAAEVTTYLQASIDQVLESPAPITQRFVAAPGTTIRLAIVAENAYLGALSLGGISAVTRTITTSTGTTGGIMTQIIEIDIPTSTTGNLGTIGGNTVLANTRIVNNFNIDLVANTTTPLVVGESFGNPILLQNIGDFLALQKLIDMHAESKMLTDSLYPGSTQTLSPAYKWTYRDAIRSYLAKGIPLDTTTATIDSISKYFATAFYKIEGNISLPVEFLGLGNTTTRFNGFIDGSSGYLYYSVGTTEFSNAGDLSLGFIRYGGNIDTRKLSILRNVLIHGSSVITTTKTTNVYCGVLGGNIDGLDALFDNCTSNGFFRINGTGNMYAGGFFGRTRNMSMLSSPTLMPSATPNDKLMDQRLKFNGLGAELIANSTNSTVYLGGLTGYVDNSYLAGANIFFHSGLLQGQGEVNSYVGGVAGYFVNSANSAIRGNSLLGDSRFTLKSTANTGEAVVGGMVGYVNQTGSQCWLYNNIVNTDLENTDNTDGTISATDVGANSTANIYVGGYYGKLNDVSNTTLIISGGRTLLNGTFNISGIRNGTAINARVGGGLAGNYESTKGQMYIGGMVGYGYWDFDNQQAGGVPMVLNFDDIHLTATEKRSVKDGGTYANNYISNFSGKTCVGLLSGFINMAARSFTNLTVNLSNSCFIAERDAGATALGSIYMGGLFGAIGKPGDLTTAATSSTAITTFTDCNLNFTNVDLKLNQLSYNSNPYYGSVAGLVNTGNVNVMQCGGMVGGAYNTRLKNCNIEAVKTTISAIQNGLGGSDMCASDVHVGGAIGFTLWGIIEGGTIKGKNNRNDYKLSMITNSASNSPCIGGAIGQPWGGVAITDFETLNPRIVALNKLNISQLSIYALGYNKTTQNNVDILVGGAIGAYFNSGAVATTMSVMANTNVTNCDINAVGTAKQMVRVGGMMGSMYYNVTPAKPIIQNCISSFNRITGSSQTYYSTAAGILADVYTMPCQIANSMSLNDTITASSTEHNSICAGIVGTNDNAGARRVSLYSCFSNSTLININPNINNSITGGLVGLDNATNATASNPLIDNSFFHQQKAGIDFPYNKGSAATTVAKTKAPKGFNLDFSNILLDANNPSDSVYYPSSAPNEFLLENYAGITPTFYAYKSNITYQGKETTRPVNVFHQSNFTNKWNISRVLGGSSSALSELWLTPWGAGASDKLFGIKKSVIVYEGIAPNPETVHLFPGDNIAGDEITDLTFGDKEYETSVFGDPLQFTAYTHDDDEPPGPPANYADGFHNVTWKFYSDASATTEIFASTYNLYAQFNIGNNTLTITPNILLYNRVTFYCRAFDFNSETNIASPILEIKILPIYVESIDINPIYGDGTTTLGKQSNPYLLLPSSTYVLTANVAPSNSSVKTYSFLLYPAQNISNNAFTKANNTFIGWNTAADGSGTPYTNGQNITISTNITLFAQWVTGTPAAYTVSFDGNGSTSGTTAAQAFSHNTAQNIRTNGFLNTDYTFVGWNTAADGSGTAYFNLQNITISANMTLYAQWALTATIYTLTYNVNSGIGTMPLQIFTTGIAQNLRTNTLTRTNFSFNGWNTVSNGTGTSYFDGQSISISANITLYAQWVASLTNSITFNGNTGSGTMTAQTLSLPTGISLNSDGTVQVSTNPSSTPFSILAKSDGIKDPAITGNTTTYAYDTIWLQVTQAPISMLFENINLSSNFTGNTTTIRDSVSDYKFAISPAVSYTLKGTNCKNLFVTLYLDSLGIKRKDTICHIVINNSLQLQNLVYGNFTTGQLFLSGNELEKLIQKSNCSILDSIKFSIEYYPLINVVFDAHYVQISSTILPMPAVFSLFDIYDEIKDPYDTLSVQPFTKLDSMLNPRAKGFKFKGWMKSPFATETFSATDIFHSGEILYTSIRYYACWQNEIQYAFSEDAYSRYSVATSRGGASPVPTDPMVGDIYYNVHIPGQFVGEPNPYTYGNWLDYDAVPTAYFLPLLFKVYVNDSVPLTDANGNYIDEHGYPSLFPFYYNPTPAPKILVNIGGTMYPTLLQPKDNLKHSEIIIGQIPLVNDTLYQYYEYELPSSIIDLYVSNSSPINGLIQIFLTSSLYFIEDMIAINETCLGNNDGEVRIYANPEFENLLKNIDLHLLDGDNNKLPNLEETVFDEFGKPIYTTFKNLPPGTYAIDYELGGKIYHVVTFDYSPTVTVGPGLIKPHGFTFNKLTQCLASPDPQIIFTVNCLNDYAYTWVDTIHTLNRFSGNPGLLRYYDDGNYWSYLTTTLVDSKDSILNSCTIKVPIDIHLAPNLDTAVCIGSPVNLVVTPNGGGASLTYQWYSSLTYPYSSSIKIAGATTPTFTVPTLISGTTYYYCAISESSIIGCDDESSLPYFKVRVYGVFNAGSIANTGQTICAGTTASIIGSSTNASGGDGNYSYQWYEGLNLITGANSASYAPSATYYNNVGTYIFTRYAKDGKCNTTFTASTNFWRLQVNDKPSIANIPTPPAVCSGQVLDLTAPNVEENGTLGTITEGWQIETAVGSGIYNPFVLPITVTIADNGKRIRYAASTTNGCGVQYSNLVVITVNPLPTPTITQSTPSCFDNTTIFTTQLGMSNYVWTVEDGTIAPPENAHEITVTWTAIGTKNVTLRYTDANSCTNSINSELPITVYPVPDFSLSATVVTDCITPNGTITITVNDIPPFSITDFHILCSSSPDTIKPSVNPITIIDLSSGNYYITVINKVTGCYEILPIDVTNTTILSIIPASISITNVTCHGGNNGVINGTVTGGTPPYTFAIYKVPNYIDSLVGKLTIISPSQFRFSSLSEGEYFIEVTDDGSCTFGTLITIIQPSALLPGSILSNQEICGGVVPAAFTSSLGSGGAGTPTYQWQSSIDNISFADISGATNPNYASGVLINTTYFRRIFSNVCGSVNSNVVTVTITPDMVAGSVSPSPSLCKNRLANFTQSTTLATGIGVSTGLPSGLTATWALDEITISGTPIVVGTFNYSIPLIGGCGTVNAIGTIHVNDIPTVANISAPVAVCTGQTLTLTAPLVTEIGTLGTITEGWEIEDAVGSGTFTTFVSPFTVVFADNGKKIRYAASTTNSCGTGYSNEVVIIVNQTSAAGTISGATTICTGSTTILTLSGHIGSIQWQQEIGSVWTNVGTGATTFTTAALSTPTKYRVIVTNGVCASSTSAEFTVAVDATTVGGTVVSDQTICNNTQPTSNLVLSGNTGSVLRWQKSLVYNFSTDVSDIAETNNELSAATIGNLTSTTYFRAFVRNGTCLVANSSPITITVHLPFITGAISNTGQTICLGTPINTIGSNSTANGGDGSYTYEWRYTKNSGSETTIGSSNSVTYTPSAEITGAGTYVYKRYAKDGVCNGFTPSANTWTLQVNDIPTIANISVLPDVCVIQDLSLTAPIVTQHGTPGTISQGWEIETAVGSGSYITFASPFTVNYADNGKNIRYAASTTIGCGTGYSNLELITVYEATVAGTVSSNQTICYNTQPTTALTLSGNTGNVVKWQKSTVADFSSLVTDIVETTTTLSAATIGNLTTTTYFRAVVKNGSCSEEISSSIQITVRPQFNAGEIASTGETFCNGATALIINSITAASGGDGVITYEWRYSFNGGIETVIAVSNSATFTPLAYQSIVGTHTFKRFAKDGTCNTTFAASTNTWTLQIVQVPTIITQPADLTVCEGKDANFSVTTDIPVTYQWQQYNTTTLVWDNLAGEENDTYNLSWAHDSDDGNQYRVILTNGICNVTSSPATLGVVECLGLVVTKLSTEDEYCSGDTIKYAIVIRNNNTATGFHFRDIELQEILPISGFVYDRYEIKSATTDVSSSTYDAISKIWDIDQLDALTGATLTLVGVAQSTSSATEPITNKVYTKRFIDHTSSPTVYADYASAIAQHKDENEVDIHPTPTVNLIAPTIPQIIGTTVYVSAQVIGGTFPYSYSWINATEDTSDESKATLIIPNSNVLVTVRVTDINGCKAIDSKTIEWICPAMRFDNANNDWYQVVKLVDRCWFKTNLRATLYQSGDTIPFAKLYTCPSCPSIANQDSLYGRLYTYEDIFNPLTPLPFNFSPLTLNPSPVCPPGWSLPTLAEWSLLQTFQLEELRSVGDWLEPNNNTNSTTFTIRPAGYWNGAANRFEKMFGYTRFWALDSENGNTQTILQIRYNCSQFEFIDVQGGAFSVRCIMD